MRSPGPQSRAEPLPDNAPHILVVDDDQKIRELLGRFLVSSGYRVTEAADAASARSFMRGLAFDLVMLDVMMPGESGLSLARDLKATRPVPILMLTALADAEDRITGLEAGVDDYVTKPFEPRELLLRLRNILRRGQAPNAQSDEIRMGPCVFSITRGELRRAPLNKNYSMKPRSGTAKLPMFGKTVLMLPVETPNHFASVALYSSTAILGIQRPSLELGTASGPVTFSTG